MDMPITSMMDPAMTNAIAAPGATNDHAKAAKAAKDFEGVFISQFLGNMFSGIKTDGPFGGGQGEEMFRSLMVNEYGKSMVARGGFDLADSLQRQLLKHQEMQTPQANSTAANATATDAAAPVVDASAIDGVTP